MTRMNPTSPLVGSPPGEIDLFSALAHADGTDGWVAFQGLELANHVSKPMGEADFIVFVPNSGILVIEVKSHNSVARDASGTWRLGRDAPTTRSPFKQATDAQFSLMQYFERRSLPQLGFPIWHAVWFSNIMRDRLPTSPEWQDWEVLDARDLRQDVVGAIRRTLSSAGSHLAKSLPGFKKVDDKPSEDDIERLSFALRSDFSAKQSPADAATQRAIELGKYLPEQIRVLDYVKSALRVVLEGAAGTGKTFIAVEAARRSAAEGHRTLLVVFNRLLADDLGRNDALSSALITVSTIHRLLLSYASVTPPSDAPDTWWRVDLPEKALERILANDSFEAPFDVLVVDEAQDIFMAPYADVLDVLLKGGLQNGRSTIAGDFTHQSIYGDGRDQMELIRDLLPDVFLCELAVNCRNTRSIGDHVNLLARLDPGYVEYRRNDEGVRPSLVFLDEGANFEAALVHEVRQYVDERYALSEIVILSPRRDSTARNATDPWLKDRMSFDLAPSTRIRCGTIHEFKGLEAPVVIVTDVDDDVHFNLAELFYIGITRATSRLSIVARKSTMLKHSQVGVRK